MAELERERMNASPTSVKDLDEAEENYPLTREKFDQELSSRREYVHPSTMLSSSVATSTAGISPIVKSKLLALILLAPLAGFFYTHNFSATPDIPRHEQMILTARDAHRGNLLDPLGRPNPICQSQYMEKGSSRSSPLIFERDNLMVCQTPKVGSTELRCIQQAYDAKMKFRGESPNGKNCNPKYVEALSQLHEVEDESTFNDYLFGDRVDRIMFVRHPVRRILSGFLQVAIKFSKEFWKEYKFKGDLGHGPEAFHSWIMNSTFMFQYDPVCSHASTFFARSAMFQHYAPPQHCRCGIWDCGAEWTVYKIEDDPLLSVMRQYIPGRWIPPDTAKVVRREGLHHVSAHRYEEKDYLTPEILKHLNHLTRVEQEFFGYEPLVLEDDTKTRDHTKSSKKAKKSKSNQK